MGKNIKKKKKERRKSAHYMHVTVAPHSMHTILISHGHHMIITCPLSVDIYNFIHFRNILQDVLRNWNAKAPYIVENCNQLVENAWKCVVAFNKGKKISCNHVVLSTDFV